jgi:hypothetical protein
MIISWKRVAFSLSLTLGICILVLDIGQTSHHRGEGIEGWEKDSVYNKLYDPAERENLRGVVLDFKTVTPFPGMSPGVAMLIRGSENQVVTVHLGPRSFIHLINIGIKKGDKVKVKGVWADIDDKAVFIAAKVRANGIRVLKVRRTSDGTPYWTMSHEELAMERSLE